MTRRPEFICAECQMRVAIGAPLDGDPPFTLDPTQLATGQGWRSFELYAAEFDRLAGDRRFTALEFLAWLAPSVKGHDRHRGTQSITMLNMGERQRDRLVGEDDAA